MAAPACTQDQFIELWHKLGSPTKVAKALGVHVRNVYYRRNEIERRTGKPIAAWAGKVASIRYEIHEQLDNHPAVKALEIHDGTVLIGSDAHYIPGLITTAHRAFVAFCRTLKPAAVVMNGDVCDFGRISRHPAICWESTPTVIQEIEVCRDRLEEIEKASPKGAAMVWNLGNHDARFETRLASVAPEFAKVHGVHLKDHFPRWHPAWMTTINNDAVIKHRFKNGIHAPHNNTINAGKSMVTGHMHSLRVSPWTDYNGTRWGVDCGTLAEPYGPQFQDYTELNPVSWRSGFAVLTFRAGKLLMPELVQKWDENTVQFRGHLLNADTAELI